MISHARTCGARARNRGAVLFLLASVALVGAPRFIASSDGARVQGMLQPEAVVRGSRIHLGDLGIFQGDETLAALVRAVVIGQTPLPGRGREIDLDYIRIRLRQSRLDPDRIELLAPPRLRVRGAGRIIAPDEQIRHAEAAIRRACRPDPGAEISIEPLSQPLPLTVPDGDVTITVAAGPATDSIRTVRLQVLVDGAPFATASIPMRVRRLVDAWVAARSLAPGERLAAEDARIEKRDVAGLEPVFPTSRQVAGLRARRSLSAGSAIPAPALEAAPDIHRGDTITVIMRAGAIRVRVEARALEDGAAGDDIRVVNTSGGREYRAQVTGPGAALIAAGPG